MATIVLRLHLKKLCNPDLDLRYALPDIIEERSGGLITDDGYDYTADAIAPDLLLFLRAENTDAACNLIQEILRTETVCGNNNLSDAVSVSVES